MRAFRLALWLCTAVALTGCFRARVDVELFDAGDGSIRVELGVDRQKIPPLFGDPLADVGSFDDLRSYSGPGIVAWAEPQRARRDHWDSVTLEAFFDDLNELRFVRPREAAPGEKPVYEDALSFDYDGARQPGLVRLQANLDEELSAPLSPPDRPGLDLSPEVVRNVATLFKPMLNDLTLSLHLHAPGPIRRASGFTQLKGSTASIVAQRDQVLAALSQSAGNLVDAKALLADDAAIAWQPKPQDAAGRARFERRRDAATHWWNTQVAAARAERGQ
jgi:hypothetical protein